MDVILKKYFWILNLVAIAAASPWVQSVWLLRCF